MSLFDITRKVSRFNDTTIANKSTQRKKVATTFKGGGNLLNRIQKVQQLVNDKLGYLKGKFILIRDESALNKYIDVALSNGVISIDTETTGLDPMLDKIVGICIYTPNEKGAYIPINHISYITGEKSPNQLSIDIILEQFKRIKDIDVIMFNADFDIRVLRNQLGWKGAYCTWDCYLAMRLLNENETVNKLKPLHNKYVLDGEKETFSFDDLFKGITFDLIPLSVAELYAGNDPVITYELYEYQHKYLREDNEREDMRKLFWVFKNIEMPCVDVVSNMEDAGIKLDLDYQQELSVKYHKLLDDKLKEIYTEIDKYKDEIDAYINSYENDYKVEVIPKYNMTGGSGYVGLDYWNPNKDAGKKIKVYNRVKLSDPINISSPTQLAVLFYDILNVGVIDKQKPRGTGEDILKKIDIPLAKLILDYRGIEKLINTYIDKLPNCINPNDNRIHCKFNQYGADTGRMSSSNPNLQNIPSHNKDIRKMFVASDGYVLMSSDFSQQEPKCLSALCKQQGDSQMYDTFMQGKDLYTEIASKAFNLPYEECLEHFPKDTPIKKKGNKWYYATLDDYDKIADGENDTYADGKERRTQAKSILLGALYGRGVASIAEQLGCSVEQAQEIKDSVFKGFPAIKHFEETSLQMAKTVGYVTTVCGRKRRLPDLLLDRYEFHYKNGKKASDDVLNFSNDSTTEIPLYDVRRYLNKLNNCNYKNRASVIRNIESDGVEVVDNSIKIAIATRQCVNARIQGSASDLTKLAMIDIHNNARLKELGFRLLIPVHDEVIAECPEENAKECSKLLAEIMSKSAEKILEMPIKCDVEVTKQWYGEVINIDEDI